MHLTYLAIGLWLLAAAPTRPSSPAASKANDARTKVQAYLAGHDVADAGELRELVGTPDDPLMAIATDARIDGLLRARAVAALRLVPTPEAHTFLEKLVQAKAKSSDAADCLILRRAAVSLGWLAGPRAPEQLALLFDNGDAEVRLDAVIGIGLTRAASAPALLRRQLATESVARVRDQIERQLRTLEPSPSPAQDAAAPKQRQPMRGGF